MESLDEELVEFFEREAYLRLQGEELLLKERVWKNFGLFGMSDYRKYVILNLKLCFSLQNDRNLGAAKSRTARFLRVLAARNEEKYFRAVVVRAHELEKCGMA